MRYGIVGYGNLGQAAAQVLRAEGEEAVIFTRRPPEQLTGAPYPVLPRAALTPEAAVDCLLLCGGSSQDLLGEAPELAGSFDLVDSYDRHALAAGHRCDTDRAARAGGHAAILSVGWDPGLLSLLRLYATAMMPYARVETFWGEGISQGHSEAVRRIPGVRDAVAVTLPDREALSAARAAVTGMAREWGDGGRAGDTASSRHRRLCYVVAAEAEQARIAAAIRAMPDYFLGYETEIRFVSAEECRRQRGSLAHRGELIAAGGGAWGEAGLHVTLRMSSNPAFTAHVMLAAARAAHRRSMRGLYGAVTLLDIPPRELMPLCDGLL